MHPFYLSSLWGLIFQDKSSIRKNVFLDFLCFPLSIFLPCSVVPSHYTRYAGQKFAGRKVFCGNLPFREALILFQSIKLTLLIVMHPYTANAFLLSGILPSELNSPMTTDVKLLNSILKAVTLYFPTHTGPGFGPGDVGLSHLPAPHPTSSSHRKPSRTKGKPLSAVTSKQLLSA